MPPDADCECGAGARVQPGPAPAQARAWTEHEHDEPHSPGESRRLLAPPTSLQAGLTLVVWATQKKHDVSTPAFKRGKPKVKTKFQKRKEKLIAALKPPYFTLTMIVIIVLSHLSLSRDGAAGLQWRPGAWWREPWRLLTYSLVHANDTHLAINALVALAVGWVLEREQSWWRVGAVWWGGVACGALGEGVMQPHMHVVGASAAVYALLTAHLPNVALRFGHVPLWWFRPLSVAVLVVSEGCWSLLRPAPTHDASSVAWAAHLYGALVGVPIGFLVFTGESVGARRVLFARVLSALVLSGGLAVSAAHYAGWHETHAHVPAREIAQHVQTHL